MYSLGIVLVEIAHWRSIDKVMEVPKEEGKARARVRDVRRLLLEEEYLEVVDGMMGQVYGGIVRRCLAGIEGGDGEGQKEGGVRMLESFADEVVGKLGDIKV